MNIFIIGPSGCGKSTQAKLLADKFGLVHLSMGQLLRDEVSLNSPFGIEVKEYLDQGKWAPNELIVRILTINLEKINNQNFIVDGVPRHIDQLKMFEQYLKEKNQSISAIVHIDLTTQEIINRRQKVAQAGENFQTGRNDETPEAIASRQKSYDESIGPIFDYLAQDLRLIRVDGNRPIEPIFNDICQKVNQLLISNP